MKHILIALLMVISGRLVGQQLINSDQKKELLNLTLMFSEKHKADILEARELILERGLLIDDKYLLAGLSENGEPLFLKDNNSSAAFSTGVTQVAPLGRLGLNLTGSGMDVGVWEVNTPRVTHQEVAGRLILVDDNEVLSTHATHVNATIMGKGIDPRARGMAPDAFSRSFTAQGDNGEMASFAANGFLISNHSYGFVRGWDDGFWNGNEEISSTEDYLFGFYDNNAAAWDQIAINAPYYLIVNSAGNERNDSGSGFPQDGNQGSGFDCISHGSLSKNVLTVGAVLPLNKTVESTSDIRMSTFSSWGPTDDGRIKPDVVGAGVSIYSASSISDDSYAVLQGTSMSSPNVAGSILLVQEFSKRWRDKYLISSTLKGLVIHTAQEAGEWDGPDFSYGWGLVDVSGCVELLKKEQSLGISLKEDTLKNGETYEYNFEYLDEGSDIRATLTWLDPRGIPVEAQLDPTNAMLINDLDLRIFNEIGVEFFPWTFEGLTIGSPVAVGDNSRDNVEQIVLRDIPSGNYKIVVSHKSTLIEEQQFSLILTYEDFRSPSDPFYWIGTETGSWEDEANWSNEVQGEAGSKIPGLDDVVIFEASLNETLEVSISEDAMIRQLSVFGEGKVEIISINNSSLTIEGDLIIDGQLDFNGVSGVYFKPNSNNRTLLDFGNNVLNVPLFFDDESGDWVLENFQAASEIHLIRANQLELSNSELAFDVLFVANTWTDSDIFYGVSIDIAKEVRIEGAVDLMNTEFDFSSAPSSQFVGTSGLKVGSISCANTSFNLIGGITVLDFEIDGGRIKMENNNTLESLVLKGVESWLLGASSTQRLGNLIIDSSEETLAISSDGSETATLYGDQARRFCLDNLDVTRVNVSGSTFFVGGANSLFSESEGWVEIDCENHLFANYELTSNCLRSSASFVDLSTGVPISWEWDFGFEAQTSTEENPTINFPAEGSYTVRLKIENEAGESSEFENSVNIITSDLEDPTYEQIGDILRATSSSDFYEWYKDDVLIGTSNFIVLDGTSGTYFLQVSDGTCVLTSEIFLVLGVEEDSMKSLMIYPNPSEKSHVNLSFEDDFLGKVRLQIITIEGRIVYNKEISKKKFRMTHSLNISNLEDGIYLLGYVYEGERLMRKFIKQ